jgi:hypothetical protein
MTDAPPSPSPEPRRITWLGTLRRFHARVGLAGATFGLLFGATGFLMNHRSVMKIEAGHSSERKVQVQLLQPFATVEALATDLGQRLGYRPSQLRWRIQAPRPVRFGGTPVTAAEQWVVMLNGHAHFARATYIPGNLTVELEQHDANMLEALQRLHKSEGSQAGWILLTDAFAGALIFLSLSGTLLRTRLAGPRLLAAGLVLGAVATAVATASRAW